MNCLKHENIPRLPSMIDRLQHHLSQPNPEFQLHKSRKKVVWLTLTVHVQAFSVSLPARISFFLSLERGPYPQRLSMVIELLFRLSSKHREPLGTHSPNLELIYLIYEQP